MHVGKPFLQLQCRPCERGKERRHISCAMARDTLSVALDNANRRLHLRYVPHFPAWPRENISSECFFLCLCENFHISTKVEFDLHIFVCPHNIWTICDSFISHVIFFCPYNVWASFELCTQRLCYGSRNL